MTLSGNTVIQPKSLPQQLHISLTTNTHPLPIHEYRAGKVKSVSGVDFDLEARKLASVFIQYQLNHDPVLVLLDGGLVFLSILTAAIYSGTSIAPCPIPTKKQDYERLLSIINDLQFKSVIVHAKDLQKIKNSLPHLNIIAAESLIADTTPLAPIMSFQKPNNNVSIIQYSSGSTARPKGVLITPQMILANKETVYFHWKFSPDMRHLCWLPHYHDMGLFGGLLYPLLSSQWLMIMAPQEFIKRPSVWLKLISQYKINVSGGPPFAYDLCLRYLKDNLASELDLSSWSIAFCGADYVPATLKAEVTERLSECNFAADAFFACYGLAETVLFVGGERYVNEDAPFSVPLEFKTGSTNTLPCYLGTSHPNIHIFSLESNKSLADGLEGEICLAGDAIFSNYTSGDLPFFFYQQRRWFKTGDVGIINNHFLTITGRLKDIIKIRGKSLYPIDFSVLANALFPELNPHAFLLNMEDGADLLSFSIESYKKHGSFSDTEIANTLQVAFNDAFGVFINNIHIHPRNTLPRTTSGKIKRWNIEQERHATT
jgi:acyl-CoA synthetase (AMP-forming)/AMP-acid ligase II